MHEALAGRLCGGNSRNRTHSLMARSLSSATCVDSLRSKQCCCGLLAPNSGDVRHESETWGRHAPSRRHRRYFPYAPTQHASKSPDSSRRGTAMRRSRTPMHAPRLRCYVLYSEGDSAKAALRSHSVKAARSSCADRDGVVRRHW